MTTIKFCNKKIPWGNAVFFLLLFVAFLDAVLYNDARATKDLFADFRIIPQAVKLICLTMMATYTFFAYHRPASMPLRIFEYSLWFLVLLIAANLLRADRLYQFACAARAYYWIFAYFFFRLTIHTVSNLRIKIGILSFLILLLGLQMHLAALSWTELHHHGQMEAFSSNAALCFQYILLLLLCYYRFSARALIVFLICAGLVLLSLKRSVIISTGLSLVLLVFSFFRLKQYRTAGALLVLAVAVILPIVFLFHPQVNLRFRRIHHSDDSQRWWRYTESYHRWNAADIQSRLIGFGFYDTSFYLQDIYYSQRREARPMPLHSHSDFFQILPDLGVLGLTQLFAMHLALLGILWKCWKERSIFLPTMMVFYCYYLFIAMLNGAIARFETLYLMLPLATICHHLERTSSHETDRPQQNAKSAELRLNHD